MTKKHLIFPIHVWPEDVAKNESYVLMFRDEEPFHAGIWDSEWEEEASASKVYIDSGMDIVALQPGDTYIILSEGEVVEGYDAVPISPLSDEEREPIPE